MIQFWKLQKIFLFVILASSELQAAERSFSTSVITMAELLQTERKLIESTTEFIQSLQQKVDIVHSFIKSFSVEYAKSNGNAERYLSNPINSFTLVRRTQVELPKLLAYLRAPVELGINRENLSFPTDTDLSEASEGIQRIQSIYELDPIDMAKGRLKSESYNTPLSTLELFSLGYTFFKTGRFNDAALWLNASLNTVPFVRPYEKLSTFDVGMANKLYVDSLTYENRSSDALLALQYAKQFYDDDLYQEKENIIKQLPEHKRREYEEFFYGHCCTRVTKARLENLHCRYNKTSDPYYLLAPFKMEELSLDPYIVIYYDVLTDAEISEMMNISKDKLRRAAVVDNTNGTYTRHRTVQNAWFMKSEFSYISQRSESITNLNASGFEDIAVMNYGLGGHYSAHHDFLQPYNDHYMRRFGDRVATALFYISDVTQGGGTTFPSLNLTVQPQKGALLFWYNLHNSGDADEFTLHGACPVLSGSKWVVTVWIRQFAQFRNRLCYNPKAK